MTSGATEEAVLETLLEQLRLHGHQPFLVRKESTGFIHNRIWAGKRMRISEQRRRNLMIKIQFPAIKREALSVVAEGVAYPSDVDALFKSRFRTPQGPFEIMDGVGLDVVARLFLPWLFW